MLIFEAASINEFRGTSLLGPDTAPVRRRECQRIGRRRPKGNRSVSANASAEEVQWEIDAVSCCCLVVTMIREGRGVNGQSVEIEYDRLLEMKR